MSERWPAVAKYFGLEGVGPADDHVLRTGECIKKQPAYFGRALVQVFKSEFLDTYGYYLTFDRQLRRRQGQWGFMTMSIRLHLGTRPSTDSKRLACLTKSSRRIHP